MQEFLKTKFIQDNMDSLKFSDFLINNLKFQKYGIVGIELCNTFVKYLKQF